MKKVLISIISIVFLVSFILLYALIPTNKSVYSGLKNRDSLRMYYENLSTKEPPQLMEYIGELSNENTCTSLILYSLIGKKFDLEMAFNEASRIFITTYNFLDNDSNNEDAKNEKVYVCYYYIMLARQLDKKMPEENLNIIKGFYKKYIGNISSFQYAGKMIEMNIRDRLSYIGAYINEQSIDNDNIKPYSDKLINLALKDFKTFNEKSKHDVESLVNLMYALSVLKQLNYNGYDKIEPLDDLILDFILLGDFDKMEYYEKAIFLNKFLLLYDKNVKPIEIKKIVNEILLCVENDPLLTSSLRFECITLINKYGLINNNIKTFLDSLAHNASYGFYKDRILIPTCRNIYFLSQIQKILGIEKNVVDKYINDELDNISDNFISFEDMYYFLLNSSENKQLVKKYKTKNRVNINKAKDYVSMTELNDQNLIQFYYALKILLKSGNANYAKQFINRLKDYISIAKLTYGQSPEFIYIKTLYKDIISYYPKNFKDSNPIWEEVIQIKDNDLYLHTLGLYVQIADRIGNKPRKEVSKEISKILVHYKTKTGYCPEKFEEYTTLSATYYGLYIEYYLQTLK